MMFANPLLAGVEAKLEQAGKHKDTLREAVERFNKSAVKASGASFDDEAGEWVETLHYVPEPTDEITLIFGDLVHNLRAALDHLAYQMVNRPDVEPLGDKTAIDKIQLPITWNPDEYSDWQIRGASSQARAAVKGLQPFGDQTHPLWLIHWLDIWDKHRLLVVLAHEITGVAAVWKPDAFETWRGRDPGPIKGSTEIARWTLKPGVEPDMDMRPYVGFGLCVSEPRGIEGWDILRLADQMWAVAQITAMRLAPYVAAPSPSKG